MDLRDLSYQISIIKEVAVIGREFSAYGMEYALVGLLNTNDRTELVLLEYDEHRSDDDFCTEPENMTNREIALFDKNMRKGLVDLLGEVEICGKKFDDEGYHGSLLDGAMDGDLYVLAEFMKQGWKSEKFFDYPPECVFLHFIRLNEKIESLATLDLSQQIRLAAYETRKEDFTEIKLGLEIEKDIDKTVSLFDGEEQICIKRVHLVDISEEECIEKEYISKICPKGMRIPVVEYTCSNDNLFIDNISLSSYLDSLNSDSYNGFATEDGVIGIGIGIVLTENNANTKTYTIQQAVKADTNQIECEIIRCSKEIENPQIEEFLI